MARRLSSMFGLSKDGPSDTSQPISHATPQEPHIASQMAPSGTGKLSKHKAITKSPSLMDLAHTSVNSPLPLPPVVTDMGVQPSARDSRRSSRAESQGTRESSGSRPSTPNYLAVPLSSSPTQNTAQGLKITKRKSWLPGRKDKSNATEDDEPTSTEAWVAGLREHVPYDMSPLLRGDKVAELWDPNANVDVYLFPQQIGRGPSFRVSSSLFADSQVLKYVHEHMSSFELDSHVPISQSLASLREFSFQEENRSSSHKHFLQSQTLPTLSNAQPLHHSSLPRQILQLPLDFEGNYTEPGAIPRGDDVEVLVLYRNFVSFLAGGALISTPRQNSLYSIFMGISSILSYLRYGNDKQSSWGTVPWSSFSRYTDELRLADVRQSREKTIEAIVLGEAMKSWPLYNEGFVHAVGRLAEIKQINSPKFSKISPITVSRLERANLDLQGRLTTVRNKLENFDFPSMFAGIANSQSATEAKLVRFKAWKVAFLDFRGFVMSQYKRRYGAWPPKASSKKNNFEENGLNRQLLLEVYQDFTDLYDMLVDRQSLTTRTVDMPSLASDAQSGSNETIQHVLRSMESEHDRSVPPVTPPIPFDVPLIPAFASSFNREHILTKKDPNAQRLKDTDVNALLLGSYNRESMKPTDFCQQFLEYERKLGAGKTVQELVDNRCGQWLFLYAILQALPLTVVDARDLHYTEGCENFLCMAPRGGRPWMKEDTSSSRAWYNVASGGGLVSLPADLIDHSVEGIYRRSHCWQIANKWAEDLIDPLDQGERTRLELLTGAGQQTQPPELVVPTAIDDRRRSSSRTSPLLHPSTAAGFDVNGQGQSSPRRESVSFGLERTTPPPQEQRRPSVVLNPNITFDNILGSSTEKTGKKGNKKK